jgi:hypothetical protein
MSGATVTNNTPDTLTVTLLDGNGVTALGTFPSIVPGGVFNLGSFYRAAFLEVAGPGTPAMGAVYLTDRSFIEIQGVSTAGYTFNEVDQGNYESTFFTGFLTVVGVFLCVFMVRLVRRAMSP